MKRNPLVFSALLLIKSYRYFISPVLPPSCRFYPSCSQYCEEAIKKRGFKEGLRLALGRIARCHPLSRGGYDPIK
ncbi:MAG: membrane protein insertion efficiency factor YidD [Deltaproteobacteria bacterium]